MRFLLLLFAMSLLQPAIAQVNGLQSSNNVLQFKYADGTPIPAPRDPVAENRPGEASHLNVRLRLCQASYLACGEKIHFLYIAPKRRLKGKYYLEYRFDSGQHVFPIDSAKGLATEWQAVLATYGLGDSLRYFDTLFVRFLLADGRSVYHTMWGFPTADMRLLHATDSDRLLSVLDLTPFDYGATYTDDTVFVRLYSVASYSPTKRLHKYVAMLADVIHYFVFSDRKRVICISLYDDQRQYVASYFADPDDFGEGHNYH